jgi:hypothetical protein
MLRIAPAEQRRELCLLIAALGISQPFPSIAECVNHTGERLAKTLNSGVGEITR